MFLTRGQNYFLTKGWVSVRQHNLSLVIVYCYIRPFMLEKNPFDIVDVIGRTLPLF